MASWELVPYKSVGPICFTDTKEDIVKKLDGLRTVSLQGDCLAYKGVLFDFSEDDNIFRVVLGSTDEGIELQYKSMILNRLDYQFSLNALFRQNYDIYRNYSYLSYFVKALGIYFIPTEDPIDSLILSGIEMGPIESFPELSNEDILISHKEQII